MTDKEKILALEIENARMRRAFERIDGWSFAFDDRKFNGDHKELLKYIIEGLARPLLTVQPSSDVMGKLRGVRDIIRESLPYRVRTGSDKYVSDREKDFCEALVILKELGVK